MQVLYAGDSLAGGPADYVLGILKTLGSDYVHVPPSKKIQPRTLEKRYDVIILSDFSRKNVPAACERAIIQQVRGGAGLLMVGGWGSFSGPFGHWRGSHVEKLLPVSCVNGDDRVNLPSGGRIHLKKPHPVVRGLDFKNPPVLVGFNRVRPKKESKVILTIRGLQEKKEHPLLVVSNGKHPRAAAFTTDLAPHWCGGLVDWGSKRIRIAVNGKNWIEIGNRYARFVSSLLRWLASGRNGFASV